MYHGHYKHVTKNSWKRINLKIFTNIAETLGAAIYIYLNTEHWSKVMSSLYVELMKTDRWWSAELQIPAKSAKGEERGNRERNLWQEKMLYFKKHKSKLELAYVLL